MRVEWKTCFRIGVSIFILYLCITYWSFAAGLIGTVFSAAMPLLIGCIIAYVINILMSFYERYYFPKSKKQGVKKSRRIVCMLAAFATLLLLVIFLVRLVVPELMDCVQLLAAQVPKTINSLLDWMKTKNIVPADLLAPLQ
ncbi:MAG: AI-2E family transporter, partial [Lachnospiraceae bacterium]|nr:AI-2E family transporter [Lachnospiraceae bacterium]